MCDTNVFYGKYFFFIMKRPCATGDYSMQFGISAHLNTSIIQFTYFSYRSVDLFKNLALSLTVQMLP